MQEFSGILESMNHARRIRDAVASGELTIPPVPRGKQALADGDYPIGSTVVATGTGTVKAGTVLTVTDRWKQHGYWYYRTDIGGVQRQQDIRAAD